MILQILQYPDPMLRVSSAPILSVTDRIRQLAVNMFETMYDAPGRGLAAPQVGVPERLFVLDATWKEGRPDPIAFVNPEILAQSPGVTSNEETCLSIPGKPVIVARPDWITLMWMDLNGAQKRGRFDGFAAACICHEIDHLDGQLILDKQAA